MTAYAIFRVKVTDPERYEKYKLLSPGAVAAHGGRFIVRGGESEVLEGEPEDRRLVVLEFPDLDAARAFYDSPEYLDARKARAGAAEMQMIIVEGC
ncbi:MAG: DUF1330 domain-containing protein [Acidimicrobiales bacterium]